VTITDTARLRKMSKHEHKFFMLWDACGGPKLQSEYRFHPTRKWRFDFAYPIYPHGGFAIELQGGVWRRGGGAHRGSGFERDCEKLLEANLAGWTVFQLNEKQIVAPTLQRIIALIDRVHLPITPTAADFIAGRAG
jgi:hypothetical protein